MDGGDTDAHAGANRNKARRVAFKNHGALGRRDVQRPRRRRWCGGSGRVRRGSRTGASRREQARAQCRRNHGRSAWRRPSRSAPCRRRACGNIRWAGASGRARSAAGLRSGSPWKIWLKPSAILSAEERNHAAHVVGDDLQRRQPGSKIPAKISRGNAGAGFVGPAEREPDLVFRFLLRGDSRRRWPGASDGSRRGRSSWVIKGRRAARIPGC